MKLSIISSIGGGALASHQQLFNSMKQYGSIDTNEQPVIGILSQPLDSDFDGDSRFDGYDSYLMAAYVKFVEAAGARVVPLIWGEPEEVTMDKLSKLNGVLFPGGANDYNDFGRMIIGKLIEYNDNGLIYPAYGICHGFQSMAIWASDAGENLLKAYGAHAISLPITFVVDPSESKLWADLGEDAFKFENYAMTLNSHNWGVDPESFKTDAGLASFYRLTSVSYTPADARPFGATMEAFNYPFTGTQFHPEKVLFMYGDNNGVNHSWESITLNRYFADNFVQMARQNTNSFGDFATTQKQIVANCKMIVTDTFAGETYVFNSKADGCN